MTGRVRAGRVGDKSQRCRGVASGLAKRGQTAFVAREHDGTMRRGGVRLQRSYVRVLNRAGGSLRERAMPDAEAIGADTEQPAAVHRPLSRKREAEGVTRRKSRKWRARVDLSRVTLTQGFRGNQAKMTDPNAIRCDDRQSS